MSQKKTSKNIVLAIMGILIIFTLAASILKAILTDTPAIWLNNITFLGIAAYGFWLYKKPHGNMLKYTMLLFAFTVAYSSCRAVFLYGDGFADLFTGVLAAGAICYVAGRLNRIERNRILMPIIALVLLVDFLLDVICAPEAPFLQHVSAARFFVTFLTLCCAYFTRYQEHKEAGLADK